MEFTLNKNLLKENVYNLVRKSGYRFQERDDKNSELIFVRPLNRSGYPRFHLYIKNTEENLIFDLHLDQKKPIYRGAHAHSGEYEGEVVEKEVERIKENLNLI
jgi:hypothetical protein